MRNKVISELRLYICNNWINHIPSHSLRKWYYKHIMKFRLGKGATIQMNCRFDAVKGLVLGENSIINSHCRIDTRGDILIGKNVAISQNSTFLTADHDLNSHDFKGRIFPVQIEDFVWVGTQVVILPGCSIKYGSVIGVGSVITKDVPELTVWVGNPARFIKNRSPNFDYTTQHIRLFH